MLAEIDRFPVKWSGEVAELVGCTLVLTEYSDTEWHVALPQAQHGQVIGQAESATSKDEAMFFVEAKFREMLRTRIRRARENFKHYEAMGFFDA